jgi:hypothetical protein
MSNDNEHDILHRLSLIVAKHADWLDGRTFQRLCQQVAEAYFEEGDRDRLVVLTPEAAQFADAMIEALQETGHD